MHRRWTAWAACGAVAALALLDLWVGVRPQLAPVPEGEMRAGAEALSSRAQPGDVFVHSPLFGVPELKALGDLRARPDRPSDEVLASRRVLLLDRAAHPMFGLGRPDEVLAVGAHLEVKVYEPEGDLEVPVFDLLTDLEAGMLRVERPPGRVAARCVQPRHEGGWACPGQPDWLYAAPRTLRIGGEDVQCVWAHPTTGGAMVFELPAPAAPPEGRALTLALKGGLTDDAARGTPGGASVFTEVRQGGRSLGRLTTPNRVGWHTLEVDVAPGAPIELSITTPRDGRRHFCIDARILERPMNGGPK